MSSFGGRWSAAPPHGGSPSAIAKEPSHNGRRSHGLCRPGPTIRRPSLERAPRRVLRRRRSLSLELVPACESSARCLTDARRKRRFFGPRRSDRILQHETDARARPDGLPLLSRSGLAAPDSLMVIACAVPCGEPCRSTWSPGCALSSPSSLRECLAGLHTSREASSEGSPSNACSRRPRSHNLSPAKPRPSPGYPDSSRDTRWISTVAARAGGSKRRTGTFHSPVRGCSVRVPLLESLRTSSCHRSPTRASWREIRPPTSTGQDRRLVRHPAKDGAFSTARMFGSAPR
jgi:hypothetical protein